MKPERAIEILENRDKEYNVDELNEACRLGAAALRLMMSVMPDKPEKPKGAGETSLKMIGLGTREYNCLTRAGMKTAEDVARYRAEHLYVNRWWRNIRNLGAKGARHVENRLRELGLI